MKYAIYFGIVALLVLAAFAQETATQPDPADLNADNLYQIQDLSSFSDPAAMQQAFTTKFPGKTIGSLGAITKITEGGLLQAVSSITGETSEIDPNTFPDGEFEVDDEGNIVFTPTEDGSSLPGKGQYVVRSEGTDIWIESGLAKPYAVSAPNGQDINIVDGSIMLEPGQNVVVEGYDFSNNGDANVNIGFYDEPITGSVPGILRNNPDTFENGITIYTKGLERGVVGRNVQNVQITTPTGNSVMPESVSTFSLEYTFPEGLFLRKGSSDSRANMLLQQTLNDLGYTDNEGNPLVVDGDFGAKTEHAFTSMQKDLEKMGYLTQYGADGTFGEETRQAMETVFGPSLFVADGNVNTDNVQVGEHVLQKPGNIETGLRVDEVDNSYSFADSDIENDVQADGVKGNDISQSPSLVPSPSSRLGADFITAQQLIKEGRYSEARQLLGVPGREYSSRTGRNEQWSSLLAGKSDQELSIIYQSMIEEDFSRINAETDAHLTDPLATSGRCQQYANDMNVMLNWENAWDHRVSTSAVSSVRRYNGKSYETETFDLSDPNSEYRLNQRVGAIVNMHGSGRYTHGGIHVGYNQDGEPIIAHSWGGHMKLAPLSVIEQQNYQRSQRVGRTSDDDSPRYIVPSYKA